MSDVKRCKDLWDFYIMLERVEPVMADELMGLIKQSELERHKAIEDEKAYASSLELTIGDHIKAMDELQQENERLKQGWIIVDDRLPEDMFYVLVRTVSGRIITATYVVDEPNLERYWHLSDGELLDFDFVTHWQPLPQPPSEDV